MDTMIITEEMIQTASWNITNQEAFLINGIIRKHKPKKCLEIGVGKGDISILILNAIKDIPKSSLVSIDINKKLIEDHSKIIGYKVSKYFPNVILGKYLYILALHKLKIIVYLVMQVFLKDGLMNF